MHRNLVESNSSNHERQNFKVKKYRWSNQQCEQKKNSLIIKAMLHKRETRTLKSLFSILSVGEFILEHENKNNITFK